MGFYSGSISYTPYAVQGEPGIDYMEQMFESLLQNRFVSFDEVDFSESTMGWVSARNFLHNHFTQDEVFPSRDHILISLRLDKKVVPSQMLKALLPEREQQYQRESGKERLTRDDRIFIKEQTRQFLIKQQYPQTKVWDMLYNVPAGRVSLARRLRQPMISLWSTSARPLIERSPWLPPIGAWGTWS